MAVLVACPKCKTRLKISHFTAATMKMQCPKCQTYFMVSAPKETAVSARPQAPASAGARRTDPDEEPKRRSSKAKYLLLLLPLFLLFGGGGGGVYYYLQEYGSRDKPVASADSASKDTGAVAKKTETPEPKKEDKKSPLFAELMTKGQLDAKAGRYQAAIDQFAEALKINPDDADAKKGKTDAETALTTQVQAKKAEDKIRFDTNIFLKQGNEAIANRNYSAAVEFFKLAIQKSPGDADAKNGLTIAAEAAARNADEKKKMDDAEAKKQKMVDDYNGYLTGAKAALETKAFADAYQKAVLAQGVFPAEADFVAKAVAVRKQAEEGLAGVTNNDERRKQFTQLMVQGGAALQNKRADEAEQVYKQALALFPDDPNAAKGLSDAQALGKQLKAQFDTLMAQGTQAKLDGRLSDAVKAFQDAVALFPSDPAANAALSDAQQALNVATLYNQAMQRAATAMLLRNYQAAIAGYNDALAAVPSDLAATQGLLNAQQLWAAYLVAKQQVDANLAQAIFLLQQQQNLPASQLLNASIQLLPTHPNIGYIQQMAMYANGMVAGQLAANNKRYADAVAGYTGAVSGVGPLAIDPINDPVAQVFLVNANQFLAAAQLTLANATQAFNTNFLAGSAYLAQPKYPNASTSFSNALAASPFDPRAPQAAAWKAYADAMGNGQTAMKAKNYPNAVQAYTTALTAVPNDPTAFQALANAQKLAGITPAPPALTPQQKDFEAKVLQANNLLKALKYAEASQMFATAILAMPKDPQVPGLQKLVRYADSMDKGVAAFSIKNYDDAVTAFGEALVSVPKDVAAQKGLQDAQKALQGISSSKDFDTRVTQGKALLAQKKYVDAAKMLNEAIRAMPKHPQVADVQTQAAYADAMARGLAAMTNKNYANAVGAFTDAQKAIANDFAAQQGLQEAQQALKGFNVAKDFDTKVSQGKARLGEKKYFEAGKLLHEAVKLMPKNPQAAEIEHWAYYADAMGRGQTAMLGKNFNSAVTAYGEALKSIPNDPVALQGQQDARQALQGASVAKDFDSKVQQGGALLRLHKYVEASKLYYDAIKLAPTHPQVPAVQKQAQYADAMHQGHQALKLKNYPDAVSGYSAALRVVPGDPTAQQGLKEAQSAIQNAGNAKEYNLKVKHAKALLKQQKWAEASQLFNEAIKLMPDNRDAASEAKYADAMVKGFAALNIRNFREAVIHFRAALDAVPSDMIAASALKSALKQAK